MNARIEGQLLLPREPMALDLSYIAGRKNQLHAFVSAADLGGLEDKQAGAGAGMDGATWSRFKQGDVGIKPLNFNGFLDQVGNDLPLAYWAYSRGYQLVPLETETQRRLRLEREANEALVKENALLRNLLVGRAA